ncbi:MAG: DUF1669 domain-containing protein [Endomicrobiales bacterium]|nr:DUF1669 domain-containing protein [Endomicrobiales bacterium]
MKKIVLALIAAAVCLIGTDPPAGKRASWGQSLYAETQVLFSPRGGVQKKILEHIEGSFQSIDVMCFRFTSRPLAKAIVKAHEKGVRVRIILDKSQQVDSKYSKYKYMKEKGVDIRLVSGIDHGIMHNKAAIFDDRIVLTGSYNWTTSAEKYNCENAVFSDDPGLVFEFKKEFNDLWKR